MFRKGKASPDVRIMREREHEQRREVLQRSVQDQRTVEAAAEWQARSSMRQQRSIQLRQDSSQEEQRQATALAERATAAAHAAVEEAERQAQLMASCPSNTERRTALTHRARELAASREEQRKELAAAAKERLFRENCDPLRQLQTRRLESTFAAKQQEQVVEKQETLKEQKRQDQGWEQLSVREQEAAQQRYEMDKARERVAADALVHLLDDQVDARAARLSIERSEQRKESEALKVQWAAEERDAREAEWQSRQYQQHVSMLAKKSHRQREIACAASEEAERAEERRLLVEAVAHESRQAAVDVAARAERQQAERQYRKELEGLLERQQLDTAEQEALIGRYQAEQRARSDAELAARRQAQQRLMDEVQASQREQRALHQAQRDQAAGYNRDERERLLVLQADEAREAASRRAAEGQAELLHRARNEAEVEARQALHAREAAAAKRDRSLAADTERETEAKIKALLLEPSVPVPYFGRRKVAWYT